MGYKPAVSLQSLDKKESKQSRALLYKLGIAGFCFSNIMLLAFPEYSLPFLSQSPEAWLDANKEFFRWGMFLLSLPVMFYSAPDYFKSAWQRSEEHTSEFQSRGHLVCRPLLEKQNNREEAHTTRKYGKESAMQTSNAHEKEEKMTPCQSPIANE